MTCRASVANKSFERHPRRNGAAAWPALKGVADGASAPYAPSAVAAQFRFVRHQQRHATMKTHARHKATAIAALVCLGLGVGMLFAADSDERKNEAIKILLK